MEELTLIISLRPKGGSAYCLADGNMSVEEKYRYAKDSNGNVLKIRGDSVNIKIEDAKWHIMSDEDIDGFIAWLNLHKNHHARRLV